MKTARLITTVVMALALALGGTVSAEMLVGETEDLFVTSWDPYYRTLPDGTHEWVFEIDHPNSTFLKVHFSYFQLPESSRLSIRDAQGQEVASYTSATELPSQAHWANSVIGDYAQLVYTTPKIDRDLGFVIDSYGYGFRPIVPESICGSDDKENIRCYGGTHFTRSRPVGRMLYQKSGSWYVCTGFLVSPDNHFLTNEHCINSQTVCNTLEVRFNYERDGCSASSPMMSYTTADCDQFITSNYYYDFGFLTLTNNPAGTYGYEPLDPRALVYNEDIYIIQHPGGSPKEIAFGYISNTSVYGRTADSDFAHRADTEGGSSGSPVFDSSHNVVGLHHYGGCTSSGGANQAVKMQEVYPYISAYLSATPTVQID